MHPRFKKILQETIEKECEKNQKKVENIPENNRLFGLARMSCTLVNSNLLDAKILSTIAEELKFSLVPLVMFLCENAKIIQKHNLDTFLKLSDYLYEQKFNTFGDIVGKETIEESTEKFFKSFYDKFLPEEKQIEGYVLPSFKYAVYKIQQKTIDGQYDNQQYKYENYFCIDNPKDCAKYLLQSATIDKDNAEFSVNILSDIKKIKNDLDFIAEVVKITKENLIDIFLNRKFVKDFYYFVIFAKSLFDENFMSQEDFILCVDAMLDAFAFHKTVEIHSCLMAVNRSFSFKNPTKDNVLKRHQMECFMLNYSLKFEEELSKKVKVTEKPLEFTDLKSKKIEVAAQMIIDSVCIVNKEHQTDYLKFCNHIQKYKPIFVKSLKHFIKQKISELAIFPLTKNFLWNDFIRFGQFLVMLEKEFENLNEKPSFITQFLQEIFDRFEKLTDVVTGLQLINTYDEISRENEEIVYVENVWVLDYFYKSELRKQYWNFEHVYKEIIVKFHQTLYEYLITDEDILVLLSPSLMVYFKHMENKQQYTGSVLIDDPKNHSKFFVQTASIKFHDNHQLYVKQLVKWKKMKPSEFIFKETNEHEYLKAVIDEVKNTFNEIFFNNNQKLKSLAFGLCKLIPELYIFDLITSKKFEDYFDIIIDITRKKSSELNLHCYHNIVVMPMGEMKKRNDDSMFQKSISTQKEFENLMGNIKTNMTYLKAKNLSDEVLKIEPADERIESNDVAGPSGLINLTKDKKDLEAKDEM